MGNLDRAEIDARADVMIDDVVRLLCERKVRRKKARTTYDEPRLRRRDGGER